MAARWDKGGKDYINCPLDKPQYEDFVAALVDGEKMPFHDWEKDTPYFEGCMPIEVMAERGPETLRYGPMKGVGLDNPRTGRWPYAVVQLRQDNALGTLWNMVGFQTKLKHGEQVRIFRTIPGLENAEFARLGGIHRNSFINSPRLLDRELRLKSKPNIRFAGQITGCEGYVESAAVGILAARFAAAELRGETLAAAAGRNRARRAARPHHRRRRRRDLPADERQFRPDAAARRAAAKGRPQESLHRPRARSAGGVAGAAEGRRTRLIAVLLRCGSCHVRCRFARSCSVLCFGGGGAVVAYSAAVSQPFASLSAPLNLSIVFAAHSSNDSAPLPLASSLAKALRRAAEQFLGLDLAVLVLVGAAEALLLAALGARLGRLERLRQPSSDALAARWRRGGQARAAARRATARSGRRRSAAGSRRQRRRRNAA